MSVYSIGGRTMVVSLQASFMNVGSLERSIEFYQSVLHFEVVARESQAAVLVVTKQPPVQTLVLREAPRHAHHGGGSSIGPAVLAFEAGSRDEFEEIQKRFAERDQILGHRRAEGWEVLFGHDPDRIQIVVSVGTRGSPIRAEDWSNLDAITYALGS